MKLTPETRHGTIMAALTTHIMCVVSAALTVLRPPPFSHSHWPTLVFDKGYAILARKDVSSRSSVAVWAACYGHLWSPGR